MQIVTANRLSDGRVVFLANDGIWMVEIAGARVLEAQAEVEQALAEAARAVAAQHVLDPYAIDVESGPAGLVPKSLREKIRAGGPTVPSDFPEERLAHAGSAHPALKAPAAA